MPINSSDSDINLHVVLERPAPLHLILNTKKGRGVFATRSISSGTVIDISPVLILDTKENQEHIEKTSLYHYTYNWPTTSKDGKTLKTQAVVFGLGSLFNHSNRDQNVGWKRDLDREVIVYRALRDVKEGEELCISYGSNIWFEDADRPEEDVVIEEPEEVLGRIEVDEVPIAQSYEHGTSLS